MCKGCSSDCQMSLQYVMAFITWSWSRSQQRWDIFMKRNVIYSKNSFPCVCPSPHIFMTDEWKTASTSIQIKLGIIILISIGLVARSNYYKWELKRFSTDHFNSQMACLRMSYKGKAPVRLQRRVCLSSSSAACSRSNEAWQTHLCSGGLLWHTSAMSVKNILIKLIEEITESDLRR